MPQTVELPDKTTVEFPDDASPEEINKAIDKAYPQFAPKQAAKPRGLTTMQVLAQASPMGGEFSYAPQQAEAAAAGLPRTTELEGISQPLVPIPRIPQQESTAAQIGAGAVNTLAGFGEFLESPLGVATGVLGTVGPIARRLIAGGYAASMGTQTPALAQRAGEVSVTGTPQEKTEAYLSGGAQVALTGVLGASALAPRTVAAAGGVRNLTYKGPRLDEAKVEATPGATPVTAIAPAPTPQHPLLRAADVVDTAGERVRQSGLAPALEVTRALADLRRQLEIARHRPGIAGQQPAQAAAGAMATGAAAPGEASAAALATARAAIANALEKVNKSRAKPADPQEIADALLAAAGAVRAFHNTLPPPAPAPGAQPEGGPGASEVSTSTEVHGPVRTQPVEGTGQVPVAQGSGRVQPQATGGVRQQTPPPAPQGLATTPPEELTGTQSTALTAPLKPDRLLTMSGTEFMRTVDVGSAFIGDPKEGVIRSDVAEETVASLMLAQDVPLFERAIAKLEKELPPYDPAYWDGPLANTPEGIEVRGQTYRLSLMKGVLTRYWSMQPGTKFLESIRASNLHLTQQTQVMANRMRPSDVARYEQALALAKETLAKQTEATKGLRPSVEVQDELNGLRLQVEMLGDTLAKYYQRPTSARKSATLTPAEPTKPTTTTGTIGEPWMMSLEQFKAATPEPGKLAPIPGTILAIDLAREDAHSLGRFSVTDLRMLADIEGVPKRGTKAQLMQDLLTRRPTRLLMENATKDTLMALDNPTLVRMQAELNLQLPPDYTKEARVNALLARWQDIAKDRAEAQLRAHHYLAVREALKAGKPVPPEVRAEYPRLGGEKPPEKPPETPPEEPPSTTQEDMGPSGETTTQPDPGPEPGDPPAVSEQKDNALGASGGSPHGLPPGVPPGPPTYAAELLEATRRLGSLARSKATLRPGILGQFVQTLAGDKIYTGDIRNQRVTGHEIGHNLDVTLFTGRGALGHSMQSLVARIGGPVSKLDLFNQLKSVSELMRGPLAGSAYRRRASELIADWVSLYLHDPARARSMAPDWATGFERELARNVDAQETVSQLLSGNVQPIPGQVAPGASSVTQTAVQLPGKLPGHPRIPPVAHDYNAAVAAQNIVKQSIRTLEANMQRVRVFTEKAHKLVPDQSQRNDVGAFVEGIGNLERQGDDIGAVKARMTPKMERLAKDYRLKQELQRQEINRYLKGTEGDEYLAFLQDYMGHFYLDSRSAIGQAMSRFLKDSPHAKARQIPTLKEAVDYGLHPITQDPVLTYELTARTNWRVATNRRAVAQLKNIVLASGDPVVVPMGQAPLGWVKTHNPLLERIYARQVAPGKLNLWKGGAAVHPDVWRAVRQLLEQPTSSLLGRAYDAINGASRAAAFSISGFHDISLRMASGGTGIMGATGFRRLNPFRGWIRLLERDPVTSELKRFQFTRKAGKALLASEDAVADAAQHGLRFAWTDTEAYQHASRDLVDKMIARVKDVPFLGEAGRIVKAGNDFRQKGLWRNTHDAYKIMAYHDLVSKALQRAPATADPVAIKERVASLLNDAYGGQEWQTQFWMAPEWRRIVSRFLLAPDWTMSTIRSVPLVSDTVTALRTHRPLRGVASKLPFDWAQQYAQKPLPGLYEGVGGNLDRLRFWSAELIGVAAATVAAQYVIYRTLGDPKKGDRKWIWDNEYGVGPGNIGNNKYAVDVTPIMRHMPGFPWNEKDTPDTRSYMNLGKRSAEVLRWMFDWPANVQSKMSRPGMEFIKQVTGSEGKFKAEWMQDHANWLEFNSLKARFASFAKEFLPFSLTGNQFALSVPRHKGMTPWKAVEAYVSVYEVAADPSHASRWIKSKLRGQPLAEGDVVSMVDQISDAAYRNGHNAEELRKRALSIVHGKYLHDMFKAFKDNDSKSFNTAFDALVRLGGSPANIRESFKRRLKLETEPLSLFPAPEP